MGSPVTCASAGRCRPGSASDDKTSAVGHSIVMLYCVVAVVVVDVLVVDVFLGVYVSVAVVVLPMRCDVRGIKCARCSSFAPVPVGVIRVIDRT